MAEGETTYEFQSITCGVAMYMLLSDYIIHCHPTYRECALLKDNAKCLSHNMCTRASTLYASKATRAQALPPNIRHIQWKELQASCSGSMVLIGKGTFARCYYMKLGTMKVCIKIFNSYEKYKALFCAEARILALVCHCNLPWLHAVSDNSSKIAIMMTYHSYEGDKSVSVYDALSKNVEIRKSGWQQVLVGCTSALIYLQSKDILHNDIKSDNILIETTESGAVRAVLIDFNKACLAGEGRFYTLTPSEKKKYIKNHPQIAPEVREGYGCQTFASDLYAFGRIMYKINDIILTIPYLHSLSLLCLSESPVKRPTADELHKSLNNLFH